MTHLRKMMLEEPGAEIGFFSVLHAWGHNLLHHPHIHCLITVGGLPPDHRGWIFPRYRFFLLCGLLSRVFRGKFVAALKRVLQKGELYLPGELRSLADEKAFHSFLRTLYRHKEFMISSELKQESCACRWSAVLALL